MTSVGLVIAVAGLLTTSAASMAQGTGSYPDMRGQWTGTSEAVASGTGPHTRSDSEPGKPRTSNQEFTLNITHQEGPKFWAELVSKNDERERLA